MSRTSPAPDAGTPDEKRKVRAVVEQRQLVGAANDAKWGVLLDKMREREGWIPSYRWKCVDGPAMGWDVEWWYHLPLPMMSVEWFDIGLVQESSNGRLLPPKVTDHRDWILRVLDEAQLCYEVRGDIVRVFGYLPKRYDGMDDAS